MEDGMTAKPLKVCQVCAVDFTLKNFLLPLIDGMRSRGWAVTAVCSNGPYISDLRQQGYAIKTIPIARSMNPFKAIISLFALIKFFRFERFDIVHVHTPVAALIARVAAKLCGVPIVIYTAHGFFFHDDMSALKRIFFVYLEKLGGHLTDVLFTQSAEDAETAMNDRIVPNSRVTVIGNGVDITRFNPYSVGSGESTRLALGIPRDAFVVGFIGRRVREKGLGEFLEAMVLLAGRHPRLWVLVIGDRLDSDHSSGIEQELNDAKKVLGPQLLPLGLRADIPQLLSGMDLFCLPSWREGMPRTIIEAMMLAKPILATDIRGSREEVVSEKTGLLVPPRSSGELAKAAERFICDPKWSRQLGRAGRKRALELFDERKVIELQLDRITKAVTEYGIVG
jgi:glycosyltransferase involved in cell wall biosynthesis